MKNLFRILLLVFAVALVGPYFIPRDNEQSWALAARDYHLSNLIGIFARECAVDHWQYGAGFLSKGGEVRLQAARDCLRWGRALPITYLTTQRQLDLIWADTLLQADEYATATATYLNIARSPHITTAMGPESDNAFAWWSAVVASNGTGEVESTLTIGREALEVLASDAFALRLADYWAEARFLAGDVVDLRTVGNREVPAFTYHRAEITRLMIDLLVTEGRVEEAAALREGFLADPDLPETSGFITSFRDHTRMDLTLARGDTAELDAILPTWLGPAADIEAMFGPEARPRQTNLDALLGALQLLEGLDRCDEAVALLEAQPIGREVPEHWFTAWALAEEEVWYWQNYQCNIASLAGNETAADNACSAREIVWSAFEVEANFANGLPVELPERLEPSACVAG